MNNTILSSSEWVSLIWESDKFFICRNSQGNCFKADRHVLAQDKRYRKLTLFFIYQKTAALARQNPTTNWEFTSSRLTTLADKHERHLNAKRFSCLYRLCERIHNYIYTKRFRTTSHLLKELARTLPKTTSQVQTVSSDQKSPLERLPPEMIRQIGSHMERHTVGQFQKSCKRIEKALGEDNLFWRNLGVAERMPQEWLQSKQTMANHFRTSLTNNLKANFRRYIAGISHPITGGRWASGKDRFAILRGTDQIVLRSDNHTGEALPLQICTETTSLEHQAYTKLRGTAFHVVLNPCCPLSKEQRQTLLQNYLANPEDANLKSQVEELYITTCHHFPQWIRQSVALFEKLGYQIWLKTPKPASILQKIDSGFRVSAKEISDTANVVVKNYFGETK